MTRVLKYLKYLKIRMRSSFRYFVVRAVSFLRNNNYEVININPNEVIYTVSENDKTLKGNSFWHFGKTSSGDWDLGGCLVKEYGHIYTILKQRIEEKKEFAQITEYINNVRRIKKGETPDNCTNVEDYRQKWIRIEKLYNKIKNEGYKTQAQLVTGNFLDEVRIQIGRKGDMLFEEGIHRLVIAQLLNLKEFPVVVYRRHSEWARLREDLIKIVIERGFFHQPFNHADLDMIPQRIGNQLKDQAMYGNERWDYITKNLPFTSGDVLDIGAYFGYFCHRFENLGFKCYAVENDPMNLKVLKRYRKIKDKHFCVWEKSIFDIERFEFDIVLALNIFHHLVKDRKNYNNLTKFINQLKCKALFFEPHRNNEPGVYKGFSDQEFIDFVISNTALRHSRFIGHSKEGRNLYLLTK